jgi:RNA polymerase sigma-70 factor (ECF subfamily)
MGITDERKLIASYFYQLTDNDELVTELTQLASIKIFKSNSNFENDARKCAWIKKLVRNIYIDYYRNKRAKKNSHVFYVDDYNFFTGTSEHTADAKFDIDYDRIEKVNKILDCADKLSEKERDTFLLRIYYNLSFDEIAEFFNCSRNTALAYMHRAKNKIKEMYDRNTN